MSKKMSLCYKCSHRVVSEKKRTKKDGSCPVVYEELIGCDLCDNPKAGDNCPFIKRARKPTVVVHLWNGTIADIISNDPNVDVVFVDQDDYSDENNAKTKEGEPCRLEIYKGSKNMNPKNVKYWREKALRSATEVSDVFGRK
jgi:hypothetical protein